tara:strand:- start:32 stop:409 length:378 start_codon:yes stop_codon:yes gene_type:complete
MPWLASLYIAFMVITLPFGLALVRRMENDWLHPVGGFLSSLLSIAFIVSYWMPELVPFQGWSVLLMFFYIVGWDAYMLWRLKYNLPEVLEAPEENPDGAAASLFVGIFLMLPAYIIAALVCLRAV